jgi:hypothetical protein
MLFSKYVLEDLSVGSGSIIGKDNVVPKRDHKGSLKTHLDIISCIVEKTPIVDPDASFIITSSLDVT